MSRTCIKTTGLHAYIHTDRRRQDGPTIGRTNERKENTQTDRVTNNITQICIQVDPRADGHMDGRTHRKTIFELVDRQTEIYTILYNYIRTGGRIEH